MTPDFEAILRSVPPVPCLRCYACLHGTGRCSESQPNIPAMAQAVQEAVEQDRDDLLTTISMLTQERNVAGTERDALRAEKENGKDWGSVMLNAIWKGIGLDVAACIKAKNGVNAQDVIDVFDALRAEVEDYKRALADGDKPLLDVIKSKDRITDFYRADVEGLRAEVERLTKELEEYRGNAGR